MDQTTTSSSDAWTLAALGAAVGVAVDRTLNNPQVIQSTTAYGLDQNGNLYQQGQPAATPAPAPAPGGGGMKILMLIGLILLVTHHG